MLKFKTHGKWILAGEHAVLRGGKALVFPVSSRCLEFIFDPDASSEFRLDIGDSNPDHEYGFWAVLERALQILSLDKSQLSGTLRVQSDIPVGAGMGASATICVSLARWLTALGHLPELDQFDFAKKLEDLFHGQSSGVDVAVALYNKPLEFVKPNTMKVFEPQWKPPLYLSYCGRPGMTSVCIQRVQALIDKQPQLAQSIDQDMQTAVENAKTALLSRSVLGDGSDPEFSLLKKSIEQASECFFKWDLISRELDQHMQWLKAQGAVAVKPTGSGDGGFVLSLWENREVPSLKDQLIEA